MFSDKGRCCESGGSAEKWTSPQPPRFLRYFDRIQGRPLRQSADIGRYRQETRKVALERTSVERNSFRLPENGKETE